MTWAAWMSAISIAIIAKLTCCINNWPSWRCRRKIIYSPPPHSWEIARKSLQMFASRLHCESPVTTVWASLGIKNFIIINKMTFHSSTIDWAVVKTHIQYIFINLHSSVPLIQPFVHSHSTYSHWKLQIFPLLQILQIMNQVCSNVWIVFVFCFVQIVLAVVTSQSILFFCYI